MPKAVLKNEGEQRFDLGPYGGRIKVTGTLVGGADWKGGIQARLTVMNAGITVLEKTAEGFVRYRIFPPKQEIHTKKTSVSFEQVVKAGEPAIFKAALLNPHSDTNVVVEYEKNAPPPPPPPADPGEGADAGAGLVATLASTGGETGTPWGLVGAGLATVAVLGWAVRRWSG